MPVINVADAVVNALFFVAGSVLGWYLQRRSGAAAESSLFHLTGELREEGVRSFAGEDRQSLSIADDARAALQHYRTVDSSQRDKVVHIIQNAYTNLAFGTLARADELSQKMSRDLQLGVVDVVDDACRLSWRRSDPLESLADHVFFVGRLGWAIRADRGQLCRPGGLTLPVWERRAPAARSRRVDGSGRPSRTFLSTRQRLERLRTLYAEELTVVKDWDLLERHTDELAVSAVVIDIEETAAWRAPWYLTPSGAHGSLTAVNVTCDELGENDPGRGYETAFSADIPAYPDSVEHGALPPGMRGQSIGNLKRFLGQQSFPVVCVLVYDAVVSAGRRTLVLDGNHRLAAARQLMADRRQRARSDAGSAVADAEHSQARVLAFRITEIADPIDDQCSYVDDRKHTWEWRGFTPDITLIRGDGEVPTTISLDDDNSHPPTVKRWADRIRRFAPVADDA